MTSPGDWRPLGAPLTSGRGRTDTSGPSHPLAGGQLDLGERAAVWTKVSGCAPLTGTHFPLLLLPAGPRSTPNRDGGCGLRLGLHTSGPTRGCACCVGLSFPACKRELVLHAAGKGHYARHPCPCQAPAAPHLTVSAFSLSGTHAAGNSFCIFDSLINFVLV